MNNDIKLPDNKLPKVTCVCGVVVQMNSISAHYKSNKHKLRTGEVLPHKVEEGKFLVSFK